MKVQLKLMAPDAKVPTRAHDSDAGFDLYAYPVSPIGRSLAFMDLEPKQTANVFTGVAICVPSGWSYTVRGRSSLNQKGIQTLLGTVDAGYSGGLFALLYNGGEKNYRVNRGDRVAQVVFERVHEVSLEEVAEFALPEGARGTKGFGSSGR